MVSEGLIISLSLLLPPTFLPYLEAERTCDGVQDLKRSNVLTLKSAVGLVELQWLDDMHCRMESGKLYIAVLRCFAVGIS